MFTRARLLAASLIIGGCGLIAAPALADPPAPTPNQVEFWCAIGGVKDESPDTPFVVPDPPIGTIWSLLVLKAGDEQNADPVNELFPFPTPGASYVRTDGKDISHVILCFVPIPTTTTTTSTTLPQCPEEPCVPDTQVITTTTTSTTTTTTTTLPTTTTCPDCAPGQQTVPTTASTTTTAPPGGGGAGGGGGTTAPTVTPTTVSQTATTLPVTAPPTTTATVPLPPVATDDFVPTPVQQQLPVTGDGWAVFLVIAGLAAIAFGTFVLIGVRHSR